MAGGAGQTEGSRANFTSTCSWSAQSRLGASLGGVYIFILSPQHLQLQNLSGPPAVRGASPTHLAGRQSRCYGAEAGELQGIELTQRPCLLQKETENQRGEVPCPEAPRW